MYLLNPAKSAISAPKVAFKTCKPPYSTENRQLFRLPDAIPARRRALPAGHKKNLRRLKKSLQVQFLSMSEIQLPSPKPKA